MCEKLLSPSILQKSLLHSNEYGWRREDVQEVIEDAVRAQLAILGGQPQFITPKGIFELYWVNYDSSPRRENENWIVYVHRTAREVTQEFQTRVRETNFLEEARKLPLFQNYSDIELENYLWFLLVFQADSGS